MKLLLKTANIAMLCLMSTYNMNAQWSGTNPITTTSNVGIGASPGSGLKFDVLGESRINSNLHVTSNLIGDQSTGRFCILGSGNATVAPTFDFNSIGYDGGDGRNGSIYMTAIDQTTPSQVKMGYNFMTYSSAYGYKSRARLYLNGAFAVGDVGAENFYVRADGSVSVGVPGTSAERLAVNGDIKLYNATDDVSRNIMGYTDAGSVNMYAGTGTVDGAGIRLYGPNASEHPGSIQLITNDVTPGTAAFELSTFSPGTYDFSSLFRVNKDGKTIIGTGIMNNTPGDYNLYVSKGILTEKLKVAFVTDETNWSDFVFNTDYKLPSLKEVEDFVKINKHLPEIPSAQEVTQNGIDVAAMDAKLLQKIEELTLYAIQQQKHIDAQQKNIELQQKSIEQQQKEINALKKRIR